MIDSKGQKTIMLRSLGTGFGNLTATVENTPPGSEGEKLPEAAEIFVKAASNCCGRLCNHCCCLCCIQTCSRMNDQCAIALTQLCGALACLGCFYCCEACCSGHDGWWNEIMRCPPNSCCIQCYHNRDSCKEDYCEQKYTVSRCVAIVVMHCKENDSVFRFDFSISFMCISLCQFGQKFYTPGEFLLLQLFNLCRFHQHTLYSVRRLQSFPCYNYDK